MNDSVSSVSHEDEILKEFKAALEEGSNIDSLSYELVKKIIIHIPTNGSVEKWKDKVRGAINEVFRVRIGTLDKLIYIAIKAHMENVINQVDTPNVQLIKYGMDMITESLMSFTEILEKIGGGNKNRNLNSISFNKGHSKHVTTADIIATIKSYKLEGKSFRDMEEIMGIPKTTLNSIYLKYEADEAEKIKEANRGYLDQAAHHEPS